VVALLAAPVCAQETAAPPAAESAKAENDGTDPTRPIRSARLAFEHIDVGGGLKSDQFTLGLAEPVGDGYWIVAPTMRVAALNVPGNARYGLGDASFKLTRVLTVNRKFGLVAAAEISAPTASKDILGSGKWVFKPSFIYARFLKGGHILAPAILHNVSFAGDRARGNVNLTTIDFYFVPRLSNPKLFMTLDPAVNYDWERNTAFGALAVTMGYKLGKMLGGNGQFSVKPSAGFGPNRPFDWGMQATFQLIGF
jgi:hypothetical protein